MHSPDDVRDRLEALRTIAQSTDYYGPRSKLLSGQIDALEWVLAGSETSSASRSETDSSSTPESELGSASHEVVSELDSVPEQPEDG